MLCNIFLPLPFTGGRERLYPAFTAHHGHARTAPEESLEGVQLSILRCSRSCEWIRRSGCWYAGNRAEVCITMPIFRDREHKLSPFRPQDVIIFMIGGTTYEEARAIGRLNQELSAQGGVNATRVLLGGTCVHNSSRFARSHIGQLGDDMLTARIAFCSS